MTMLTKELAPPLTDWAAADGASCLVSAINEVLIKPPVSGG